jgi:hypothetical protein
MPETRGARSVMSGDKPGCFIIKSLSSSGAILGSWGAAEISEPHLGLPSVGEYLEDKFIA